MQETAIIAFTYVHAVNKCSAYIAQYVSCFTIGGRNEFNTKKKQIN
jgi:hypothetical protein